MRLTLSLETLCETQDPGEHLENHEKRAIMMLSSKVTINDCLSLFLVHSSVSPAVLHSATRVKYSALAVRTAGSYLDCLSSLCPCALQ